MAIELEYQLFQNLFVDHDFNLPKDFYDFDLIGIKDNILGYEMSGGREKSSMRSMKATAKKDIDTQKTAEEMHRKDAWSEKISYVNFGRTI